MNIIHAGIRLAVSAALAATLPCAYAQTGAGTPATVGVGEFSSLTGGVDQVNLGNLDIHLQIPLYTTAGRGIPVTYYLQYDSNFWTVADNALAQVSSNCGMFGWVYPTYSQVLGSVSSASTQTACGPSLPYQQYIVYSTWSYTDPSGNTSSSPKLSYNECTGVGQVGNTWSKFGDQFYHIDTANPDADTVTNNDGTLYQMNGAANTAVMTDRNGNQLGFSTASNNVSAIDTLGHSVTISGLSGVCCGSSTPAVLTYTNTTGGSESVTINFTQFTVQTNFQLTNISDYGAHTWYLPTSVVYPDGSSYKFTYEATPGDSGSVTGRLASLTLPTGGVVTYQYTGSNNGMLLDTSAAGLTRTTSDGSTTYARSNIVEQTGALNLTLPISSTTTATDALGNQTVMDFVTGELYGSFQDYFETRRRIYSGSSTLLRTISTCYNGVATPCITTAVTLPFTSKTVTTTLDNSVSMKTVTTYNTNELPTEVDVYDYGASSPLQKTLTAYKAFSSNINMPANDPSSVTVEDGSGNEVAQTTYSYDGCLQNAPSGIPQHVANINSGNASSISQWVNTSGANLTTTNCFDKAGQEVSSTFNSFTTGYTYDSTYDVHLTNVSYPTPSSGVAMSTSSTYDSYYGALKSSTDQNGGVTNYPSYDWNIRPTEIDYPDGGKMTASYTATQTGVYHYMTASTYTNTQTLVDSYGRPSRSAVSNGQSTNPYYETDTCYDTDGRLEFQSYQYQGTGFGASPVCSGNGDTTSYDALNRVTKIAHGSGSAITAQYTGRAELATDEAGTKRISQADALGRTTEACEISSNANMPDGSGSPVSCGTDYSGTGFVTSYAYSLANHTMTVSQGVQSRVFQTDSLGRTVLVQEPEWKNTATTYTYAYNTTGLSMVRSRPKANQSSSTVLTTTTTQLDALGRVVTVTYSDGTPNKTFVYDAACCWSQGSSATNLKGRLAVMGAGATTTHTGALFSYDIMGRVLDMWQCAPSTCPTSAAQISRPLYFTYDWLGDIVTEQDNIAGKVQYGYSSDREVTSITNLTFTGAKYAPNLVSSVQNGPNGPVSWSLGNGLTGVSMYDVPNQALHDGGWVCKTSTQTYCTGGTQLYGWVADSATQNLPLSYDNVNGNYTYGYDEFNRLTSASINSGQTAYTYTYDRWGNRTAQTLTAGSGYSWTGLANSYNQVTGWGYDAAGNLTTDGSNNSYSYDAEGNLLTLNNPVSGLLTFVYDAWNRRVSAATTSSTNEFVYDPQGHRMSTWNAANNVGTDGRIYWGDQQIAFLSADASTYFDHQDWLGTERMRTNYQGAAAASYTSLPFGDGSTQTVGASGVNQDNTSFASA